MLLPADEFRAASPLRPALPGATHLCGRPGATEPWVQMHREPGQTGEGGQTAGAGPAPELAPALRGGPVTGGEQSAQSGPRFCSLHLPPVFLQCGSGVPRGIFQVLEFRNTQRAGHRTELSREEGGSTVQPAVQEQPAAFKHNRSELLNLKNST